MGDKKLSFQTLTEQEFAEINQVLSAKDTMDVIRWGYENFGEELVYACSFGAEGMVLLDLIAKVQKDAKIVFLDTNLHFSETYALIDRVQKRYPTLRIERVQPQLTLDEQAKTHGDELWKTNPDLCCQLRKIQPLRKALSEGRAWLSGLRRDQSPTRANTLYVNRDKKFESIKICPLIHWKWSDVWDYIRLYELEYNSLHDQGYPSIGCAPCTQPVEGNEDSRAGRWANANKTECGLHL